MWPAMSVPMSACHVATLLAVFRHLPAAAATSDLAVGCPKTARPADAGLNALGRPAEQQCTSIASSSSAADRADHTEMWAQCPEISHPVTCI